MNASHTPGPWIRSASLAIWRDRGATMVASVLCDSVSEPSIEEVANACLIAAAPDLLAALKDWVEEPFRVDWKRIDAARAAITKAEGRS